MGRPAQIRGACMNAVDNTLILRSDEGPQPLKLRSISAHIAALQNQLARVIEPVAITAEKAQIFAALDAPRQAVADAPWLSFELNGGTGAVQLPWGVARKLAGMPVEGAIGSDAGLLMEAALEPWLDQVESMLGVSFRFTSLDQTAPKAEVVTTLNLQGKDASGSFVQMRQVVYLSVRAAQAVISALEPRHVSRTDLPGLALQLAWERDSIELDVASLRSLVPGDAIELRPDEGAGRIVVENQWAAPVIQTEAGLRLKAGFAPIHTKGEYHQMSDATDIEAPITEPETAPSETPALDPVDLDEVEIRLSFHAGQTTMALRDLRALAPGAIIEMTEPANAVVDIVANGRVVGAGEMIDVAGRRAVQIRRIFTGH